MAVFRKSERNSQIAAQYATGNYNLTELGKKYSLTRERVRQICKRAGVGLPLKKHLLEEDVEKAYALLMQGSSLEKVADVIKTKLSTLENKILMLRRSKKVKKWRSPEIKDALLEYRIRIRRQQDPNYKHFWYTREERDKLYEMLLAGNTLENAAEAVGRKPVNLGQTLLRWFKKEPEKWRQPEIVKQYREYAKRFMKEYTQNHPEYAERMRKKSGEARRWHCKVRPSAIFAWYLRHRSAEEGIKHPEELAKKAGIAPGSVRHYWSGSYTPSEKNLEKLKNALNETGNTMERSMEVCHEHGFEFPGLAKQIFDYSDRRSVSAEEAAGFRKLYEGGVLPAKIAEMTGWKEKTVYEHLKKLRVYKPKNLPVTEEEIQSFIKLMEQGKPITKIAEITGRSYSAIIKRLKRLGVYKHKRLCRK